MNLGRTLLNEAVNSDECNKGSADITLIEQELNNAFESMIEYDPEIIQLHEKDVYVVEQNGNIFIEWADLSKFMESNFIDVSTAVHRLINYYDGVYSESGDYINLSKDNFYVVVDIEEEVEDLLNEAKRGSNRSKQKLVKTNTIVDHLLRNGIKLAKRKGKGKKSNRKKNKK